MLDAVQKAYKVTIGFIIVFAILVATHLGEFWPLSIYPMFSKAGKPWERALVRKVHPQMAGSVSWDTLHHLDKLPGEAFAIEEHGLFQNDFSNYLKKTAVWTESKQQGILGMFGSLEAENDLILYKVRGEMQDDGNVGYQFMPLIVVRNEQLILHPKLKTD